MNNDSEPKKKKLRRSFNYAKKQIIEVACQLGNTREAARQYDINETVIRRWIAKEPVIKAINPNRRALRGGNAKLFELLESFSIIDDESCDGFEETMLENFNVNK